MVFNCDLRRFVRIALALILSLTLVGGSWGIDRVSAADLTSSYTILKVQYPQYIQRLKDGGANDTNIETFLSNLDSDVKTRGVLNEANFNSVLYESLKEVISWKVCQPVLKAMLESFSEEINYTIEHKELHPNMLPLRNAVRDSVLGVAATNLQTPASGGGGGGPAATPISSSVANEVARQLSAGNGVINLATGGNGAITITGALLKDIATAGKALEITSSGVILRLPPQALNLPTDRTLAVSVSPLDSTQTATAQQNLSSGQKLIGSIYELHTTTEASLLGIQFQKPVTVVLSYSGNRLSGTADKSLDAFYYNEATDKWVRMNGTVDTAKQTVSFITSHFSKYAILESSPVVNPEQPPVQTGRFIDLAAGHWAAADIEKMVKLGLVNGISSTEFAPERSITRAEFATLLVKALGIVPSIQVYGRFNDVPANEWYFNVVNTAADAGLVSGYTPRNFGPNDPVTREQIAVMITQALNHKGKNTSLDNDAVSKLAAFQDSQKISAWAIGGVATGFQQGIVGGRPYNEFAPLDNATRAEAAVMILRMYNK